MHNQFINYHDLSQKLEYKIPPAASVHERIHVFTRAVHELFLSISLPFFYGSSLPPRIEDEKKANVWFDKNKLHLWQIKILTIFLSEFLKFTRAKVWVNIKANLWLYNHNYKILHFTKSKMKIRRLTKSTVWESKSEL